MHDFEVSFAQVFYTWLELMADTKNTIRDEIMKKLTFTSWDSGYLISFSRFG